MTIAPAIVRVLEVGDYSAQVQRAAALLNGGGVVVLPTETVYGAAASLKSRAAVARLRSLQPPLEGRPLVVHLAHREEAYRYLGEVNELGRRMIRKLWPGPVALVFEVPADRQREAAADLGVNPADVYDEATITLRCPDHMVATDVLGRVHGPVAVRRGSGDAHRADQAAETWGEKLDLVLDAGTPQYLKPSTIVRVREDGYQIERAGVYDQRIIERLLRTTILFVCSGNTCRSPMAEGIARQMLARKLNVAESELESRGYSVMSAGCAAFPGSRATPAAIEALRPLGADLSRHRSRPLTVELIHQADVIYVMSRGHAAAVAGLAPSASSRVVPLDPDADVDDPIGADVGVYRELAGKLTELIERRLQERSIP